jgi:hypothetical protein
MAAATPRCEATRMTKASPTELLIGARQANHLSLRPLRRSYPDAEEFWEGNWLKVAVGVRAGAFRGAFEADLRSDELQAFFEQLQPLQGSAAGTAALQSAEGWVTVRLALDQRGRLDGTCEVQDDPAMGSSLRFTLGSEPAQLAPMLAALAGILEAFPVVGTPEAPSGTLLDSLEGSGEG